MQLDADDDDQPFFKPPVAPVPPGFNEPGRLSGETQVEAAATATVEQE